MLNYATITTTTGEVPLSFGVYAAKLFCQRLGIDPAPGLVVQTFLGRQYPQAVATLIQAGAGSAAKVAGKPFILTEFEAMELADEQDAKTLNYLVNCLLGSLIDRDPEEVDAWFAEQSQKANQQPKEATQEAKKEKESFNWEELQRYAYGEMGLSTHELLFGMSLAQYSHRLEGYLKKQNRLWEEDWRRTRTIAILLRNAHFKQPTTAEKYLPLPSDKERAEKESEGSTLSPDAWIGMFNAAFGGTTIKKFPDGTITETSKKGVVTTTAPDGKVTKTNPDGTPYQPRTEKAKDAQTDAPLKVSAGESGEPKRPPSQIILPTGTFNVDPTGNENEPPFILINEEKLYCIQHEDGSWGTAKHTVKPIRNEKGHFVLPDGQYEQQLSRFRNPDGSWSEETYVAPPVPPKEPTRWG